MLKNYQSESPLPNIFSTIEKSLATHGAKQITRDYDGQGKVTAIAFVIETARGKVAVKLPARFDRVEAIFREQGYKYKPDQPYRTAWATIRDWVEAQLAILDWEMVKLEEIFLPYMVTKTGQTFFEYHQENGFLLSSGEEK